MLISTYIIHSFYLILRQKFNYAVSKSISFIFILNFYMPNEDENLKEILAGGYRASVPVVGMRIKLQKYFKFKESLNFVNLIVFVRLTELYLNLN